MDIKAKATQLVEQIKDDPTLLQQFRENPVTLLESIVGMDLPDEQILQLAELIKARIDLEKAADVVKGLGSLFKK